MKAAYVVGALIAILIACTTLGNTKTPFTLKDGYVAEFKVGDCAEIDTTVPDAPRSDGTPVEIIYVDRKYVGYIVYMDHPRVNRPSVLGFDIKSFDKFWVAVECKK